MLGRTALLVAGLALLPPIALAETGRLEPGDRLLDSGEYFDLYERSFEAGVPVTISVASTEFDPYLIVVDPNDDAGFQVDDSAGRGLDVHEVFTPGVTGTHLVIVTSATAGESGSYILTIDAALAAPPDDPLGGDPAPAADPFAGEFRSDALVLRLERSDAAYRGDLTFNGQTLPVVAQADGSALTGTFTSGGTPFPFSAALDGSTLVFETGGARYVLERQGADGAAPNPLAGAAPQPGGGAGDARAFEPRPAATPPVPSVQPEPGYMKGVVLDRHGAPIAGALVSVYGTTIAGESARFETRTQADGTFRQRVPDGIYGMSAYVERSYAGDRFEIRIPAVDGSTTVEHDAAAGGVENFVWYLEGLVEPGMNVADEFSYHGMYFTVHAAPGFEPGPHLANATIEVTLTPAGPLMDGSEGRPLVYRHVFAPDDPNVTGQTWSNQVDLWWELLDIPIGSYTMTARLIRADGTASPLRVSDECCDAAALQPSVTFHPTAFDSVRSPEPFLSKYIAP